MESNKQLKRIVDQLHKSTSRTRGVFKATDLSRILAKHINETEADKHRKEFTTQQWIYSLITSQIHGFSEIRPFTRQLQQNQDWQFVCGLNGNVPTQRQYSRKLVDETIEEILVRSFSTYQQLIPLKLQHSHETPSLLAISLLQARYRPFRMDCTSIEVSKQRYAYAQTGYVATKKKALPSVRVHTIMDGIHGIITNFHLTPGNQHESPVGELLHAEEERISPWLTEFPEYGVLRPFFVYDRGFWKKKRFEDLDNRGWGWSIPWKKRTLIGAQLEFVEFPVPPEQPLEVRVWRPNSDHPWRRIIQQPTSHNSQTWDILTGDWELPAAQVVILQKDRWDIEVLFGWIKRQLPLKKPLGTYWESFVIHCLLLLLLHIVLVYFLLLLQLPRWQDGLTYLLQDLCYSDTEPWTKSSLIQRIPIFSQGGGK